jgi:hypothetical protein
MPVNVEDSCVHLVQHLIGMTVYLKVRLPPSITISAMNMAVFVSFD